MSKELVCEVCRAEPAVGVAAVPFVPYSAAYGANCLKADAHPYRIVVANTALIGGLDQANSEWRQLVQNTLSHLSISQSQFEADVAHDIQQMDGAYSDLDSTPPE